MMRLFFAVTLAFASTVALGSSVSFQLPMMNGGDGVTYNSDDHGVMLLEFYFNGCPACNTNAPNVDRIVDEFEGMVSVVEFGYDCDQSDYTSWLSRHKPKAAVVRGCDSPVLDSLSISAYPTVVILDKDHNEAYRFVGVWSTSNIRDIRSKLASLID